MAIEEHAKSLVAMLAYLFVLPSLAMDLPSFTTTLVLTRGHIQLTPRQNLINALSVHRLDVAQGIVNADSSVVNTYGKSTVS